MYLLYMTQLYKTSNSRTISQYFTSYCNNIIAIGPFMLTRIRNVASVKRLTVHTLYLTLTYNGSNIRFRRPTDVI